MKMNRLKHVVVAVALAAQACGGEGAEAGGEVAHEADSALLFEGHYSETGSIQVYEAGGHLAVQVLGRIGVDDHLVVGELLASGDLSHAYSTLHPEAENAPEELRALDARWKRELAVAAASPEVKAAIEARAKVPASAAIVDKSRSSFLSTACQTFGPWFDQWIPDLCRFSEATTGIVQVNCTNASCNSQWVHHAGDRAFIWNEGSRPGQVGFFDINAQGGLDYYRPGTMAPQTWGYFTNNFDTVNYGVQLDRGSESFGITHHYHRVTPR
jgi:hypothetical protein